MIPIIIIIESREKLSALERLFFLIFYFILIYLFFFSFNMEVTLYLNRDELYPLPDNVTTAPD